MKLEQLGWNKACEEFFTLNATVDAFPARVVFSSHGLWRLMGVEGEELATLPGKKRGAPDTPLPVVGDWVLARRIDSETTLILAVMPRLSILARGEAGKRKTPGEAATGEQVLAANVTASLIVCGLDRDYNPRRIERFIALSYGGGVQPIVLLNKADLCADADEKSAAIAALAPGVEVVAFSAHSAEGVNRVRRLLRPYDTVCLLGSSGVGKSTLLNALSASTAQATGATSSATGKGRHTTSHRELFVLPDGVIVIDTPGLREVALADGEGLGRAYADIEALSRGCRFRDCTHEAEPGCAVLSAVADGALSGERLDGYRRLRRETRFREAAAETTKAVVERARWKSVSKSIKKYYK